MGGIRRRWEEIRGRECRRKEEVPGDQYKGQRSISNLIVKCHNSPTPPCQRRRVGGRDRRRYEDVRGIMRWCWRREEVQESQGPRVPRSRGPRVPRTKISQTRIQIRA